MASWTCLLCLTLTCVMSACGCATNTECNKGFACLKCASENQGRLGKPSLLECIVVPSKEAADIKINRVLWVKGDEDHGTLEYNEGHFSSKPGFRWAEPNLTLDYQISMLVINPSESDSGKWTCTVNTNRGLLCSSTTLFITAPDSSPTMSSSPDPSHLKLNQPEVTGLLAGHPGQEGSPNLLAKVVPPLLSVVLAIGGLS